MANAILRRAAISTVLLCWCPPVSPSQQPPDRTPDLSVHHYVRATDPNWYAKQLVPLRQELVEIDQQISTFRQARKDGRGTTGAVDLEKEPEGVTADAQLLLLQQRRTLVLQRIGEIEDEARQHEVTPGAVRSAEDAIKETGVSADANSETAVDTPEVAETEEALHQEKGRLERATNEANLLQRKLDLDTHTIYTNPEYTAQKSGKATLAAEKNQIVEKENEIRQAQQRIGDLEERLQDLRLRSANNTGVTEPHAAKIEERDEAYWRRKFAEIHYKIRILQSELDILQRELNEALLIYDPNPQKALRENVTRKNINEHRKAIEEKKKELAELQSALSDLEDELRHSGGDPGWSRE